MTSKIHHHAMLPSYSLLQMYSIMPCCQSLLSAFIIMLISQLVDISPPSFYSIHHRAFNNLYFEHAASCYVHKLILPTNSYSVHPGRIQHLSSCYRQLSTSNMQHHAIATNLGMTRQLQFDFLPEE